MKSRPLTLIRESWKKNPKHGTVTESVLRKKNPERSIGDGPKKHGIRVNMTAIYFNPYVELGLGRTSEAPLRNHQVLSFAWLFWHSIKRQPFSHFSPKNTGRMYLNWERLNNWPKWHLIKNFLERSHPIQSQGCILDIVILFCSTSVLVGYVTHHMFVMPNMP